MSRLFLLLLSAVTAFTGFAQSHGQRIQKFTESTLPSNGIKGLQLDYETGYLWIATEAGIARYNGMDFKVYNREDEPHVTDDRMLFLVKTIPAGYTPRTTRAMFFTLKKTS